MSANFLLRPQYLRHKTNLEMSSMSLLKNRIINANTGFFTKMAISTAFYGTAHKAIKALIKVPKIF
ncbi:hypothetical protein X975_04684, partial [Stegodyphus mimosarum]